MNLSLGTKRVLVVLPGVFLLVLSLLYGKEETGFVHPFVFVSLVILGFCIALARALGKAPKQKSLEIKMAARKSVILILTIIIGFVLIIVLLFALTMNNGF